MAIPTNTQMPLTIDLGAFAWEALGALAAEEGLSIEELASFSVLYYLSDRDSGRTAWRPARRQPSGEAGEPHEARQPDEARQPRGAREPRALHAAHQPHDTREPHLARRARKPYCTRPKRSACPGSLIA
jgi:hypothetical protein